jgi:hypothetical protein
MRAPIVPYIYFGDSILINSGTMIEAIPHPIPAIIRPSKKIYRFSDISRRLPMINMQSKRIIAYRELNRIVIKDNSEPISAPKYNDVDKQAYVKFFHSSDILNKTTNDFSASLMPFI